MAKFWDSSLGWVGSGWPRYHNDGRPPEISPGVYQDEIIPDIPLPLKRELAELIQALSKLAEKNKDKVSET